jgi:acylphosphatase
MERLHAIVFGRVQGVGFRYFAKAEALMHGVSGYVKNLPDKSVEVVAEGNSKNLKKFLKAIEKGPPTAFVENVKVSWSKPKNEFQNFSIKY